MVYTNLQQNYLENEVLTADPLQLVTLLYRGAIEAVSDARECLLRGDIAGRSRSITKATAILVELTSRLDHAKGGAISVSLAELYDYMIRRLNEANFEQQEKPLTEVRALLDTLLSAWQQCRPKPAAETNAAMYAPAPEEYQPLNCSF